jgi:putative transposase
LIVPGFPHHVTQRGNRRGQVFFSDEDYLLYLDLLVAQCRKWNVEIWAYCLMPTHVHMVLTPASAIGLARVLGETHRRYTSVINARLRTEGHLFQGRFGSVVMDEDYLRAAIRYIALNPVRARLVARAEDWRWSNVCAHLHGEDDGFVTRKPVLERCSDDFRTMIDPAPEPYQLVALRAAEKTGRPLGTPEFLDRIAVLAGRDARPAKRGPKPRISE